MLETASSIHSDNGGFRAVQTLEEPVETPLEAMLIDTSQERALRM